MASRIAPPARSHRAQRRASWRACLGARPLDALVGGALALAASIHLALIPEHLRAGAVLSAAFAAAALLQLVAVLALARRSGPRAHRVALLAAIAPALLWAATRTLSIIPGKAPGQGDPWGLLAAALALTAAMVLALASSASAPPRRRPRLWAATGASGFAVAYLLATGSAGLAPPDPGAPMLQTYTLTGDFSITVPALVLYALGGRLFVTITWSTAVFLPIASGLLAAQISLALRQRSCERRLASRRRGVLSIVPAMFAAPVCCGAAMLSFLGTGAVLTLATITPWLLIATCLFLACGLYGQWRIRRSPES